MLSRKQVANLQTSIGNRSAVKVIRNTAANGDAYHIKPYETTVVVINSASYTQSLYLPYVAETVGQTLTILFPDFGGGGVIYDNDDSFGNWSDLTNDADNEYAVLYNDGRGWTVLITDL